MARVMTDKELDLVADMAIGRVSMYVGGLPTPGDKLRALQNINRRVGEMVALVESEVSPPAGNGGGDA